MRYACTAMLIGLALGSVALAAAPKAAIDRKEGPCKLQKAGAFDDAKLLKMTLGHTVKVETRWRIDEFFGKQIINANVTLKNTGSTPMFAHFYAAFLDKDGNLLGCAGQGTFGDDGLDPGKETQLGSLLIPLPPDRFKDIAAYKAVLYESPKPIGK